LLCMQWRTGCTLAVVAGAGLLLGCLGVASPVLRTSPLLVTIPQGQLQGPGLLHSLSLGKVSTSTGFRWAEPCGVQGRWILACASLPMCPMRRHRWGTCAFDRRSRRLAGRACGMPPYTAFGMRRGVCVCACVCVCVCVCVGSLLPLDCWHRLGDDLGAAATRTGKAMIPLPAKTVCK
jgi:hypothetical protein